MRSFIPVTAIAGIVAGGLFIAAPAHALDCAPASVWTNSSGTLQKYAVDPTTGDLTVTATLTSPEPFGDIAIATDDGDLYGTAFEPQADAAIVRVNPTTGAEISRAAMTPTLVPTVGTTDELNALSFRPDGKVYVSSGWTTNIFVADPDAGTWAPTNPAEFPALVPPAEIQSAGDFLTLADGDVLGVALDYNTSPSWTYLIRFNFDAGTAKFVGKMDHEFYGAAQSGRWIYFAGADGAIYRLDSVPTLEDADNDITAQLEVAWSDGSAPSWWGLASPQDSGVCPAAAPAPTLPDTGGAPIPLLTIAATVLLGVGAIALVVRRSRPTP